MPLRDHFRSLLDEITSWEGLHGQWPATIVHYLRRKLPEGYTAQPRVHLGSQIEIDVASFEYEEVPNGSITTDRKGSGVVTAPWAPAVPNVAVETSLPDCDEYEILIYNARRRRYLVAAVEIVSPANKNRPEDRNIFVGKCAALLQKGVAVSIVDLVTVRHFNLYDELLAFIGHKDPSMGAEPTNLYAASCRWIKKENRTILEAWSHTLSVGRPLPTLPLWLSENLVVPLELEATYEQACNDLWIT